MKRFIIPILLVLAAVLWYLQPWGPHQRIDPAEVQQVLLEPKGAKEAQPLSQAEADQVIRWFNAAGSVVDNSHHGAPGCGQYSHLIFQLRSGEIVSVSSHMRVNRYTEPKPADYVDYYFKQAELEQYLKDWDKRADQKGC